jgi:integrase
MATITQRKNGSWHAIIRRKGHPAVYKTFAKKADAEVWAAETEREIRMGSFAGRIESEQTIFSDLVTRFKTEFAPHHYRVRKDGKEAWRYQVARLDEFFGDYSLSAIDQKLIAQFRDERITPTGGKREAVGESTVRKEIFMLSKMLGFAQTECGIPLPRGNPVDLVRKPKEGKSRDRRLTEIEWAALEREIGKSRNPCIKPAFGLAVETAMRQAELLSITWSMIDQKRRLVLLLDTDKIKTEEPRAVPLSSRAMAIIEALPRPINGGLLLPVERLTLYHAFIAACKRAGIEDYTWHDLRHEALSRLAERGDFSVLELAAISGHKTLQMLKRYTHLQTENLALKLG